MRHDLVVADVSSLPGATDVWEPRCSCGWRGVQTSEDGADALAAFHRQTTVLVAALEDVRAALGDRLLAGGPLSAAYAHKVYGTLNAAINSAISRARGGA